MRRTPWTTCLWPGLPQLWSYGSWSGLVLAFGMAVLLNVLLLVSFGWSELIGQNLRSILWACFGLFWVAAAGWSVGSCRRRAAACKVDPQRDPFSNALDYYLKGDYYQTEQALDKLLQKNDRDVDARLMLATLMRHTGRLDEAHQQIEILTRFEGSQKWQMEIEEERGLLAEAKMREARTEKVAAGCQ
jgi:hypothetical protein